tara:strand:+ start:1269 stop:1931 length:663 start_codon:yes stop_codon:yes gene_type:complete
MGPWSLVPAAMNAVTGIIRYADSRNKMNQYADQAKEAKAELDTLKAEFANLDTSNPYTNLDNTYEDLTVNQKEAEFIQQQNTQQQANILQQLRGAAGSSGIAGLAQTLANQGALSAQKAAASIGAQEAANQKLQAEEASKIQSLEREGEVMSRQAEFGKVSSLMGMAANEAQAAQAAQQMYQQQAMGGVGQFIQGVGGYATQRAKMNLPTDPVQVSPYLQ